MIKTKRILLASHGTPGARAAERLALSICPRGGKLHHLVVVPEFWKGMMGDDWLNNISAREDFKEYVESSLEAEVMQNVDRVRRAARKSGLKYEFEMSFGKPSECLLARLKKDKADLLVLGSLRPKRTTGFRSRMLSDDVLREIRIPMLVAPYPK